MNKPVKFEYKHRLCISLFHISVDFGNENVRKGTIYGIRGATISGPPGHGHALGFCSSLCCTCLCFFYIVHSFCCTHRLVLKSESESFRFIFTFTGKVILARVHNDMACVCYVFMDIIRRQGRP